MRWLQRILMLQIILLVLHVAQSYSFLKTSGKQIIDANGQPVILRGFGLGGWLVPEGYQLHVPGYGSPSSIQKMIVDLIGEDNAAAFYQVYIQNYVAAEDIQMIASWGVNSIRLPFNYRLLSPENQPDVFLESGFQIMDQVLEWCKANKLYLILDMHCAPGGQNKDNISDSDGNVARLWTESANQDHTVAIWRKIAERYANEEWIAGYDLLNEPVMPAGYTNTDLRALYMRIARAIREVDTNHILFIEGSWYATDFSALAPPFDVNLVYSFHKYWNENTPAAIQNYINLRNQTNCPIWLGESGENSNTWFYDCIQLLEKNKIGWNWWTHKKVATTTSPYSAPITAGYQRVLDYWNGNASKPSVVMAAAGLMELAEGLALSKCEFHPDVLDALLRADFGTASRPFKTHRLPGVIDCVDYDLGDQDVAYHDADYQNTKGPGNAEWNRGHVYRNDGVDIELSQDNAGAKYSIGWIESGEWLSYTIVCADSGAYSLGLRVASPNSQGQIQLLLDNQPLAPSV
ncbi:MAG: cellulase family glycosylhydrolase, partial [candidate division KSB1 bacterium]|nr:cellulase family glycosylhydrolase [candidate division KSB1 bacterium]